MASKPLLSLRKPDPMFERDADDIINGLVAHISKRARRRHKISGVQESLAVSKMVDAVMLKLRVSDLHGAAMCRIDQYYAHRAERLAQGDTHGA